MASRYLEQVHALLQHIYKTPIWKEVTLYQLTKNALLSYELKDLMQLHKINPRQLRVDLYVKGIVAIEVHGEQHDRPVKFSNEIEDVEEALERRRLLDSVKQRCLEEAGVPTVVIWYHEIDDLSPQKLQDKIFLAQQQAEKVPKQNVVHVKEPVFRTRSSSFKKPKKRGWPQRKNKWVNKNWPKRKIRNGNSD